MPILSASQPGQEALLDREPETVFAGIEEAATILGVPEEGDRVVDGMQRDLAQAGTLEGGVSALWYSSGGDLPYVGGGTGAPADGGRP